MPASSLPSFSDPTTAPSAAPSAASTTTSPTATPSPPPAAPTGTPTAAHLRADGISLSYGARRVLTDVSLTVSAGERAGLIGENGSGKSTLLRILAGLQEPDVGTVRATAPGGRIPRIGLLHQEPPFPPTDTVAQALESAVAPIRQAEHDLDRAASALADSPEDDSTLHAYTRALETAEDLRVWEIDSRIESLLAGLGLADLPRDRLTRELSGGQASRLSLAWLLLSAPDVLLLDEPTNHLDDSATAHLRDVLASWPGPVLLTSHDRAFLDEAVTALLDLDPAPIPHAVAGDLIEDGTGTGIGLTRFTAPTRTICAPAATSAPAGSASTGTSRLSSPACAGLWARTRPSAITTGSPAPSRGSPRSSTPTAMRPSSPAVSRTPATASQTWTCTRSGSLRRSCDLRASSPAQQTPPPRPHGPPPSTHPPLWPGPPLPAHPPPRPGPPGAVARPPTHPPEREDRRPALRPSSRPRERG